MKTLRWMRSVCFAGAAAALGLPAGAALAYTVPYSTPPGIILVDVSKVPLSESIPQFLWRRLGDADGNGLVDGLDFGAFRTAFNTNNAIFDLDGNGVVDGTDFGQFRQRFGIAI